MAGLAQRLQLPALERNHASRGVLAIYSGLNGAISLGLLALIAWWSHEPFIFPSLGPTAFIIFYQSQSRTAAPRIVFTAHFIGVLAGVTGLFLFGLLSAAPDLNDVTPARIGACAVAMALTLGLMVAFKVEHAPAAATTLIVALGLLRTPQALTVLMLAVLILLFQAFIINRLAGIDYPLWNPRQKASD